MAENSSAEQTEAPTARKLRNAREEGQVARSIELPAAAVTIGAIFVLFMMGGFWIQKVAELFAAGFKFDQKTLSNPDLMVTSFAHQMGESFLLIVPVLLTTAILAILSSGATGGYLFSLKSILPNFDKLSLISGFGRMFGTRAAIELAKAILKFSLVAVVLWALVSRQMDAMLQLGQMAVEPALAAAGWMIGESAMWLSLSLLIIALIDAPYQKYAFIKRMRMTKQEVKDEMKDMEGRPEVKQQIRKRQREMANNRMLQKVKDADVVITNPEHFAVALSYDPTGDGAPVLLAKGSDHMAARIREEAQKHGVEMFAAPP
ncbi:MAG: flagellar biosynthesis protein FlhB, partial [Betaproteobacteria bacterium]|nr:flagellar biosynthesis protein FlhB [Betaproteobacteria bacterium]